MKVSATVRANSKFQKIEKLGEHEFKLWVRPPARDGLANGAVIKLLSEYLGIPKSRISIEKGHTSKNKVILIE